MTSLIFYEQDYSSITAKTVLSDTYIIICTLCVMLTTTNNKVELSWQLGNSLHTACHCLHHNWKQFWFQDILNYQTLELRLLPNEFKVFLLSWPKQLFCKMTSYLCSWEKFSQWWSDQTLSNLDGSSFSCKIKITTSLQQ